MFIIDYNFEKKLEQIERGLPHNVDEDVETPNEVEIEQDICGYVCVCFYHFL